MAVGAITVTIYDRSWTSQGTITSAFLPKGSFLRNDAGDGGFVFPIYDTPAKTLVQYNRIAVVTVEESGSQTAVVAAFHIQHIVPRRIKSGDYDGYVVDVSGEGVLAELQWDNIGYTTISDGSQGATTSWLSTLLGFTQESWTVNGLPTGEAYLQAAGESVWDAMLECISQLGYGVSYAPSFALKTTGTKGRWILFVETPVSGLGILDWDNLDLVKTGATSDQVEVLDIKPIEDSHEVATRVTIYGAGIGADVFTIAAAQGNVTVPAGFSVDWTNSVITNDTLEAVSNQPVIHRLHQLGHIKPEDNEDATAIETAAIQLFWAGMAFLRDRQASRRQFYEVTFIGYPGYNYAVMQLANLVYAENSPIDAAGASNTTAVINVNDDFVVHEMHIQVPNSGKHKGLRVITMVLGEQISSEAYLRPLPNDSDIVVKKLKEHDEVLRHATASYAPTSPGGTPTYATADAPFLVISNTTNLTNERAFVAGAGLAATDGGANGSYTVNVATADTSMTINANSIQVRLAATSGLQVSTGLMIADTVAGAGLTIASKVLAVGAGDGIDVAADSIAVDVTDLIGNGLVEVATNNIALGTPTTLTVSTTNAVGVGTHAHAITSSSAVSTATAVLLATDANGRVRVQGIGVGVTASGAGVLDVATKIYINETADTFVTTGLVINQGAADDIIFSLKSSDMNGQATNFAEADTYYQIGKYSDVEGGARVWGLGEGNTAINLRAVVDTGTAVKSAAAVGPILLQAEISDGAGGTETLATGGSTRNACVIRDRGNALAIFAVDGDLYLDTVVNENNWDVHNDIALLHGLRADMMPEGHELRQRFGEFIKGAREILERSGVVHYNKDGHHFVATKRLQMLTIDALRQMYEQLDSRLAALENK